MLPLIFDEIADIFNADTVNRMSRRTGLSHGKVYRISNGMPFVLDYNLVFALQRMGYDIKIVPRKDN